MGLILRGAPLVASMLAMLVAPVQAQRIMENLDRGVVAIRKSSTEAFVSWRLLGLDPSGIEFNVYRSQNGGAWTQLNGSPLGGGTNFTDNTANLSQSNAYRVHPVIGGVEQGASESWTLPANAETAPLFRIPLQPPADRRAEKVWVGDLDGDGRYEYVICWKPTVTGLTQLLQGYKVDGTLLWTVDFGPESIDPDNIYPNAAAISTGQWDGVTVYDMDSDGTAEVIVKSANGVTFGDGATLTYGDNLTQFISVLNGVSGAEIDRVELPNPWKTINNLPLGVMFGIGYPDGVNPSLMIHAKSRTGGGGTPFNLIESAWDFIGGELSQRWSLHWDGGAPNAPTNAHNIRLLDLNGDGTDELVPGMHAIDGSGTLLWDLGNEGAVHGDRFQIGDLDPARPGLEMYGVQQNNPGGLRQYFADAATGQFIWTNVGAVNDVGRGSAVDLDPNHPGAECWAFDGLHSASGALISTNHPWPNLVIWWNGDLFGDNLNEEILEMWNHTTNTTSRLVSIYNYGTTLNSRNICSFQGDIIGDWREEMIFDSDLHDELIVFTTDHETSHRIYTLAHNPAYRNCMTTQGYRQQHIPDFFIGDGMNTPPTPDIVYAGTFTPPQAPNPPNGLAATAVAGDQIDLSWSDNSADEQGFRIERSLDGIDFSQIASMGPDVTTYSDAGLLPATTYHYRVRSYNTGGYSAFSNPDSTTTLAGSSEILVAATLPGTTLPSATGPTLATSATFDMGAGNAVALFVTAENSASGDAITATFAGQSMTLGVSINQGVQWSGIFYLIDPGTTSGEFVVTTTGSGAACAYSAVSLTGVDSVADIDAVANTSSSGTISLLTATTTDGGYVLGAAVNNGWGGSNPAPSFVSGDADLALLPSTLVGSSGHLHSHGDLPTAGTSTNVYGDLVQRNAYVALAFDASTAPPDTTPPAAPTGLVANVGDNSVSLDWANNGEPDFSSYTVYRSLTSGTGYSAIASGLGASAYVDNSASNGTTYYYVVTATDTSANESATSAEASATPEDTTAPVAPGGLAATPGDASVDLDWNDNGEPDLASYTVYRSLTSGGGYSAIASGVLASAYTDTSVTNDTTYYYVVTASDTASNESANSSEASATPAGGPAAFLQDSGAEGLVSMEAENFDGNVSQGGHDWNPITTPAGFSGTAAMRAEPGSGVYHDTNYAANSPRLDFEVNFVKTGTHYIWIRGYAEGGADDSCHVGIDGAENTTADRISEFTAGQWFWTSTTMDSGSRATLNVTSAGVHTINLWMREDGIRVDKIVLTVDPGYTPSGNGPAESPRGGSGDTTPPTANLTTASGSVTGPYDVDVAFSEAVSGLALGDFTIVGGSAGTLGGSGASYTLNVTPTVEGTVSVTLPADSAQDAAANGNLVSNTLDVTYTAPAGWTELAFDDFESGWGNYTEGGSDCSLYAGGTFAHQGSSAADIQDNSGSSSAFSLTNGLDLDAPGYTQLQVEFWYYPRSMENNEDFWLQYSSDGGSNWTTVQTWAEGTDFQNDQFYQESVTLDEGSFAFSSDVKIRFVCDASGNNDDVYIDEIRISAQ